MHFIQLKLLNNEVLYIFGPFCQLWFVFGFWFLYRKWLYWILPFVWTFQSHFKHKTHILLLDCNASSDECDEEWKRLSIRTKCKCKVHDKTKRKVWVCVNETERERERRLKYQSLMITPKLFCQIAFRLTTSILLWDKYKLQTTKCIDALQFAFCVLHSILVMKNWKNRKVFFILAYLKCLNGFELHVRLRFFSKSISWWRTQKPFDSHNNKKKHSLRLINNIDKLETHANATIHPKSQYITSFDLPRASCMIHDRSIYLTNTNS